MADIIAEVVIAIFALIGTLAGSIMVSQKQDWRLQQLERKIEKHNSILERFAIMEHDEQTQWKRIDELRAEMEALRNEK